MAGENYGMAYLQPMQAMQQMDQSAQMHPLEMLHKQSVTRLNEMQASGAELSQQLQLSGIKAMEGFKYDPTSPSKSLLDMASRLTGSGQVVLGEKTFTAAGMAMQREQQAEHLKLLDDERKVKTAGARMGIMNSAYGNLTSTSPEMMGLARQSFVTQMAAAGAQPAEIEEAVGSIEDAIKKGGPQAVEYLRRRGMTMAQQATDKLGQQRLELSKKAEGERERHNKELEQATRTREAGMADRAAAKAKAGGTSVKESRSRLSIGEAKKLAASEVAADPILTTGEGADKLAWSQRIGQRGVELVEASEREHAQNNNIPIVPLTEAVRRAKGEILAGVKQDPSTMGRLMERLGGKAGGVAKERTDVTQDEYAKLAKGAKYWHKGKEYTKE